MYVKIKQFFQLVISTSLILGSSKFHSISDPSSLSLGNALTGAQFSMDAGVINPARMFHFKKGSILFTRESRFSGSLSREIISYRSKSFPIKFIFLHEGVYNIPNTRNALYDLNGDGVLNIDERLIKGQISYFNQHRFGLIFQHAVILNNIITGIGISSYISSTLGETAHSINLNGGILKKISTIFTVGLEVNNIPILPLNWSSGIKEIPRPEIFLGGSITPILQYSWYKLNLFFDGGLSIDGRTLDDDFHISEHGGIIRYGIELGADNSFTFRFGRSNKNNLGVGFNLKSEKINITYTLGMVRDWGSSGNGHVLSLLVEGNTLKNWLNYN